VKGEDGGKGVYESEEEEEVGDPLVIGWFVTIVYRAYGREEWEYVGKDEED